MVREAGWGELFDQDEKTDSHVWPGLIPTPAVLRQLVNNALARILNCVPPETLPAWRPGQVDQNGSDIYLPNYHTCGCESINAQQTAFCAGDNNSTELSTACHYEGNARLIQRKDEARAEGEVKP